MAQKSAQTEQVVDVEEALEGLDKLLDRVKSLFEQYFLGIQKQPPTFLHSDLERKLRDLGTIQIRNTGLRYRYATLTQKYGSYNTYWRRTLRQIENGTYVRSLSKLSRKALQAGEEIPEEILAKMPKRMRDQVRRDREAALALARRREQAAGEGDFYEDFDNSRPAATPARDSRGAHLLADDDGDLDLDALFAEATAGIDEPTQTTRPPIPEPDDDDDFDNIATPPPPVATPTPSQPAPLRAATLGAPSRPVTSPNARISQPLPVVTPPVARPTVTPPSFPPIGQPAGRTTGANVIQRQPGVDPARQSQPAMPAIPRPSQPGIPAIPAPPLSRTDADQQVVGAKPLGRPGPEPRAFAPSQGVRPNPIAPGSMSGAKPVGVETMQGPFAREPSTMAPPRRSKRDTDIDATDDAPTDIPTPTRAMPSGPTPRPQIPTRPSGPIPVVTTPTGPFPTQPTPTQQSNPFPTQPTPRPSGQTPRPQMPAQATPPRPQRPGMTPTPTPTRPAQRPPPGMTDDDVNQLYKKYVQAKEMVGEQTNAQTYGKLLNTINAQAPKIMEQYKAKGVDFSVVVKDNQVIIRAKPKP